MKRFSLLFILLFFISINVLNAQCGCSGSSYTFKGALVPNSFIQTSPTITPGQYFHFYAYKDAQYTFSTCNGTAINTVLNLSGPNAGIPTTNYACNIGACGTTRSSITWKCNVTGTYSILYTRKTSTTNYCAVSSSFSTTIDYSISGGCYNESSEPNSTYSQAVNVFGSALTTTSNSKTLKGRIFPGDQDWYAIGISANGTLNINLSSLPEDYDIDLYPMTGSSSSALAFSNNSGSNSENINYLYSVAASTILYVKVYPKTNSDYHPCSDYKLDINWCHLSNNSPSTISIGSNSSSSPPTVSTNTLTWKPVTNASNYNIYIRNLSTNPTTLYPYCTNSSDTSFVIPTPILVSGNTYKWNMTASTSCGSSCSSLISNDRYFIYSSCIPTTSASISSNQTKCAGDNTIISVTHNGTGGFTYQWRKNGVNINNGQKYSAVNTSSLQINSITSGEAGNYSCFITGCNSSSATSNNCKLSVDSNLPTNPYFYISSQNNTVIPNSVIVSFSPSIPCSGCTYNWTFSGANLSSSSSQNPSVIFTASNSYISNIPYSVSLKITSCSGISSFINTISGTISNSSTSANFFLSKPEFKIGQNTKNISAVSDPVALNGVYNGFYEDLSLPIIGGEINFTRAYNTRTNDYINSLGYGWTHNYETYINPLNDSLFDIHFGDGHEDRFCLIQNGNGKMKSIFIESYKLDFKRDLNTKKYTLTYKNGTRYLFDSTGKLELIKDRYTNTISFLYINNQLIKIIGQGGRSITFSYNGTHVISATDGKRTFSYGYSNNDLVWVCNPRLDTMKYTYYSDHRMKDAYLYTGKLLFHNEYWSDGLVKSQTASDGGVFQFDYNYGGVANCTKVTFPGANTPSKLHYHDSLFREYKVIDELGYSSFTYYNENSEDTLFIDNEGNRWRKGYDSLGNKIIESSPIGTKYWKYGKYGALTQSISEVMDTTNIFLNSLANDTLIVFPNNSKIKKQYFSNGSIKSRTDIKNRTTSYFYTNFGDLEREESVIGTQKYFYDEIGRDTAVEAPLNRRTAKVFDGMNNIISVRDIDNIWSYHTYDKESNELIYIDKVGDTIYTKKYDDKGRHIQTINGKNQLVFLQTYNLRDAITSITVGLNKDSFILNDRLDKIGTVNARGVYTSIAVNKNGIPYEFNTIGLPKLTLNLNSAGQDTSKTVGNITTKTIRDAAGRIKEYINGRGGSTKYVLNFTNNFMEVTDANNNKFSVTRDVSQIITDLTDLNNQHIITQLNQLDLDSIVTDGNGKKEFKIYDQIGRNTYWKKGNNVTLTASYDLFSRPITQSYNTGEILSSMYNVKGQLVSDSSNISGTEVYAYDAITGEVLSYKDVQNTTQSYQWDINHNKTKHYYPNTTNPIIYSYGTLSVLDSLKDFNTRSYKYVYDIFGREVKFTLPNAIYYLTGYNQENQKVTKTWYYPNGTILYTDTLTRDFQDNVVNNNFYNGFDTIFNTDTINYSINNAGELTQRKLYSYGYDGSGNDTAIISDSASTLIDYTANNWFKQFKFISKNDTSLVLFKQNARGIIVSKNTNGVLVKIIIDPTTVQNKTIQERNASNIVLNNYIYGNGLVAIIDSVGKYHYPIIDIFGNAVLYVNDSIQIEDKIVYDDNLKIVKHSGTKRFDRGLMAFYGVQMLNDSIALTPYRWYDATIGRFGHRDPYTYDFNNPTTLNRYLYGNGNPLTFFDPLGLSGNKDDDLYKLSSYTFNKNNQVKEYIAIVVGESSNNYEEANAIGNVILNRLTYKQIPLEEGFINHIGGKDQYDAIGQKSYNSIINSDWDQILDKKNPYSIRIEGAINSLNDDTDYSNGAYFWNATYQKNEPDIGFNWRSYNKGIFEITQTIGGSTFFKYTNSKKSWP